MGQIRSFALICLTVAGALGVTEHAAAQRVQGPGAYFIEAAGGVTGSLAGFGLVYALRKDSCGVDDLRCDITNAGAAILASTIFSTAGVYFAGRLGDTSPNLPGATLGALVGAAAGIGVWHLIADNINIDNSTTGGMIGYSVTQGAIAALGSALATRAWPIPASPVRN